MSAPTTAPVSATTTAPVSGDTSVRRALRAVDDAGERWSAHLRGRRWADLGAAFLSNLSDHGVAWVLVAAWKARRPGPERRRAVVALALCGVASYGVNRAVKQWAGRARPAADGAQSALPVPVRSPASSSFPSGHTLASFCTAWVLPGGPPGRAAALAFATAVAASRVHLRAHHPSDVLGGAVIGAALGAVVRPVVHALAPRGVPGSRQE